MCGIAGYFSFASNVVGYPMGDALQSMAHRGPDDRGLVEINSKGEFFDHDPKRNDIGIESGSLLFGQVRFSLVDLTSAGHQPFVTANKNIVLTFNGEIYNYVELRNELAKEGCVFKTSSDTEVLALAYEQWGVGCFEKFVGFWAVAIFDRRENRLLFARDRIGKAPLYVLRNSDTLFWASEIKSLLQMVPEEKGNIRSQSVYHFANWLKKDFGNHTFYQNITTFPRGSYGWVQEDGQIDIHGYWSIPKVRKSEKDISVGEAVEQFRYLLSDAVRMRLRADAPVALQLSGGMDSSALVASAVDFSDQINAYTVKYGYGEQDEEPYARMVADFHKGYVNYHVVTPVESDLFAELPDYTKLMDEPYHSPNQLSSQHIWRQMSGDGLRAVLYGAGGDEVFAGYASEYYPPYLKDKLKRFQLGDFLKGFFQCSEYSEKIQLSDYARMLAKLMPGITRKSTHGRMPFIDKSINPLNFDSFELENPLPSKELYELLEQNMADWKMNYWLRIDNQNSMGVPVELRSPFLDHRLIEFAFTLPVNYLIRDGWMKWIIRKSMEDKLPEEVVWRRQKMGFPFPLREWLFNHKEKFLASLRDSSCPYVDINTWARNYDALNGRDPEFLWGVTSILLWWKYSVQS